MHIFIIENVGLYLGLACFVGTFLHVLLQIMTCLVLLFSCHFCNAMPCLIVIAHIILSCLAHHPTPCLDMSYLVLTCHILS